ncbi:MAG TPA: sodium:proton antiporter [Polyangiales bacterium]|nr:sodium:proton antiporter [Polyangiales bacterium]
MRHSLEVTLLILAVGSAVAIAAKRVGMAYNVALVLVGLVLVFLRVLPAQPLDPELILVGVLPVLIFEGALFANLDHLRDASKPVLTLAIPGVAIALIGTAVVAKWGLDFPFAVALLLGAILAITDTVSVLLAFRAVRVPYRLAAIMEGESLFNDGTALVLVAVTVQIATGTQTEPLAIAKDLVVAMGGGGLVGAAFGALGAMVLRATPDHLTAVLVSIVVVFGASLFAESVHTSSVIAVVVVGLALGRSARRSLSSSRVLAMNGFWETMGFSLNVLVFLLVGMQLDAPTLLAEAPAIGLALCATHVGRALAVYGSFAALRGMAHERVPTAWQHVMVVGNIKGALSMAAVLALPESVPFRSRLIAIVFGVTLVTMVTQALPFPSLLRWLGVRMRSPRGDLEGARVRLVAARSGQAELDALLAAGLVSRRAHAERKAELQREVISADRALREVDIESDDLHVESAVLQAQRGALIEAAHRGTIDIDAMHAHVAELDEQILRVRDRVEAVE